MPYGNLKHFIFYFHKKHFERIIVRNKLQMSNLQLCGKKSFMRVNIKIRSK